MFDSRLTPLGAGPCGPLFCPPPRRGSASRHPQPIALRPGGGGGLGAVVQAKVGGAPSTCAKKNNFFWSALPSPAPREKKSH